MGDLSFYFCTPYIGQSYTCMYRVLSHLYTPMHIENYDLSQAQFIDLYGCVLPFSIPLPSVLGRRRRNHSMSSKTKSARVISWDRNIVCLPACYTKYCSTPTSGIAIPRKKKNRS